MEIDLEVNHVGIHGFFSYCTVALNQICIYITQNKKLPIVSKKKLFTTFKNNHNDDISEIFFVKDLNNVKNIDSDLSFFTKDIQFTDYNKINFTLIQPIITKYFYLSDEILKIVNNIEKKYEIDYENTCCIFLRGTDKTTEVSVPNYKQVYNSLSDEDKQLKILLQSDENEFFSYFKNILPNSFYFKDEIFTISNSFRGKSGGSINHQISNIKKKLHYVKNFLAIVLIMSKCKKVYGNKGNISLWISFFRGESINLF